MSELKARFESKIHTQASPIKAGLLNKSIKDQ